jgi:ribonuclease-3
VLFALFPNEREGILSRHRATLANGPFLAQLAREVGLDACLRLGASEESSGGRRRDAAAEDAFEALVGAIHLDSDLAATRKVVLALYGDLSARLAAVGDADNPKGRLQELIQPIHGNDALRYEVIRTDGADHAKAFEIAVFLRDRRLGSGRGARRNWPRKPPPARRLPT